jgi:hypothetical protein
MRELKRKKNLETLSVDNGGTRFVVLLLGDPHLLESRKRGQDGTTDPDRVLSLRRSNNLDLHGRRSKSSDFLLHTVSNTRIHGSTTRLIDINRVSFTPLYIKALMFSLQPLPYISPCCSIYLSLFISI